jgi:hypothetical protein
LLRNREGKRLAEEDVIREPAEANEYSTITAAALGAYCDRLDRATALLKQGT